MKHLQVNFENAELVNQILKEFYLILNLDVSERVWTHLNLFALSLGSRNAFFVDGSL